MNEVFAFLTKGGFLVHIGSKSPFGRISVEALEDSPNGTKGFSFTTGAISIFYLVAEYHRSFLHLQRKAGRTGYLSFLHFNDLSTTRMTNNEEDVCMVIGVMEHNWIHLLGLVC